MSLFDSPIDSMSNDPIRAYQAEQAAMSQRAEALRPIVKSCEEAIQRSECKAAHISVKTANGMFVKVNIMAMPNKLEDLVPLFRELAKEGIHTNKREPYKDHNYMGLFGMREYDCGDVIVSAVIMPKDEKDDGCRMVQTGVKEVPVFEMVCPDKTT